MAAEVVEPKKKLNGDGSVSVEDVAKNPAVLKYLAPYYFLSHHGLYVLPRCQPQWEVFRATLLTRLRTVSACLMVLIFLLTSNTTTGL